MSPRSPLYDEGVAQVQSIITIITELNGEPIESVDDFEDRVREAEPGSRLRLYLRRFVNEDEQQPLFAFPLVPEQ